MAQEQAKKVEIIRKVAKAMDKGNLGIFEYLVDLETRLHDELPALTNLIARLKGDKGDAYVLTKADKKEIVSAMVALVDIDALAAKAKDLIEIPYEEIVDEVESRIEPPKDGEKPSKEELLALIEPLIPEPKPGEPGKDADVEEVVKKLEMNLPMLGEAIRNAIELIVEEDQKLPITALGGLEAFHQKISDAIMNRAISILDQRSSFLINRQSELKKEVETKITGIGTHQITVSDTAPFNPSVGDLWYDIS